MGDPEIPRIVKWQKLKCVCQVSALYSKPIPYILNLIEEIGQSINHITLEMSMMQRFIEDNQLDILIDSSRSSRESSSELSQSTFMDNPVTSMAITIMIPTGKRTKRGELNSEQKLNVAQNYMRWLSDEIVVRRRLTNAYINDRIAFIENQDLTARAIQNEINFLLSKVGPAVCFAKIKTGEGQGRDRQISSDRFWTVVFVNDTKRDRFIRGTQLDNITLLQQIKKLGVVRKYEEQVDVAEFYRKLLENRSFPNEIGQLTNKRMRLLCRTSLMERDVYNMRRHLEKRVAHGDELRGRIAREKNMMVRVEQSLALAVANREKERNINEKRLTLLSDYSVPEVPQYIHLSRKNEELKEIVKIWEKKVAVAKLIEDANQQKWRRLTKQGPLTV